MKKFYEILGLPENATEDQVKKAYKKLANKYHPDKNVNKSQSEQEEVKKKFQEIQQAYEILTDPAKKTEYQNSKFDGFSFNNFNFNSGFDFEEFTKQFGFGSEKFKQEWFQRGPTEDEKINDLLLEYYKEDGILKRDVYIDPEQRELKLNVIDFIPGGRALKTIKIKIPENFQGEMKVKGYGSLKKGVKGDLFIKVYRQRKPKLKTISVSLKINAIDLITENEYTFFEPTIQENVKIHLKDLQNLKQEVHIVKGDVKYIVNVKINPDFAFKNNLTEAQKAQLRKINA